MSQLAGPAVDQLAKDFTGQPVIFLEQNVDASLGNRNYRWWSAHRASGGGNSTMLPEAMASSGNEVTNGTVAFPNPTTQKYYNAFKNMVTAELARPPEASIDAFAKRVGNHLHLTVWVTNRSDRTLYAWDNSATVNAIVYEDAHVLLTDRFVREAVDTPLSPALAPNETALFELETPDLSGVNWDKLHTIAFVDYRTPGDAFDMLQAAIAIPPDLIVHPEALTFLIDQVNPSDKSSRLKLRGPADLDWTATETLPWLDVVPTGDSILNAPFVSIVHAELVEGWQQDQLTISAVGADGKHYSRSVTVKAYLGDVESTYLPLVAR